MINKKKDCPCRRLNCKNHGDCDACKKHHSRLDKKLLTTCERIEKKKKADICFV